MMKGCTITKSSPQKRARDTMMTTTSIKQPMMKRMRADFTVTLSPPSSRGSSRPSSRSCSDSEESESRLKASHNDLERRRRNELKCSFYQLRDCVPELCSQERAPKVAILKKATAYVKQLSVESQKLKAEKLRQEARNDTLKQKFEELQKKQFLHLGLQV